ncbi:MAG: hypothetical protein IJ713_06750 [Oscillibacter sp.]|nr:hypothetical protein [Oscillibacter sp.]
MASTARDLRYARRPAVDGSLAYDLDWAVRQRELEHAGERRRERETVQERPRERAVPQVRTREHVSLFAVAGMAAVIILSVLVLMNYVQLTVLSSDTVALKGQLETLQTENVVLTAQYEQMFDLTAVKEAAEAAGMSKPGSSQISYVDLSEGDSAVVYRQEEPSVLSRLLTSLHHGVYAVTEYFN